MSFVAEFSRLRDLIFPEYIDIYIFPSIYFHFYSQFCPVYYRTPDASVFLSPLIKFQFTLLTLGSRLQQLKGTPQASLEPISLDEQLKQLFLSQSFGPSIPQHCNCNFKTPIFQERELPFERFLEPLLAEQFFFPDGIS